MSNRLAHTRGSRWDIILPRLPSAPQWREAYDLWGESTPPCSAGYDVELVTGKSPIGTRHALESLAYYHRREFGYDFACYTADAHFPQHFDSRDCGRDYHFLVRTDDDSHSFAVGGLSFYWRKWSNAPAGLSLAWIWFHPYVRRQGVLTRLWPWLCDHLGAFHVDHPLSAAMSSFLTKVKHSSVAAKEEHTSHQRSTG